MELKWSVTGLFLWVKMGFVWFELCCYVPNSYEQLFLVRPKIFEHYQRPRKSPTLEAAGICICICNWLLHR